MLQYIDTSGTHLVAECGIIQRVQFVGDIFADEEPENLIKESVWLQEIGKSLSRPTQELAVLFCHDGHLSNTLTSVKVSTGRDTYFYMLRFTVFLGLIVLVVSLQIDWDTVPVSACL